MSVQNSNLDISDISSDDYEQLSQRINSFYTMDASSKAQLSYHWERNQLMLDGKQWIVYEGDSATGGQWNKLKVSRSNEYIPRPVTNYMFDVYQTLKSYLIKNKPRSKIYPNTQEHRDKTAATIGTLILEGNWTRLKEQFHYETAAANLVTYGTVFKKSYWDTTATNLVRVPKMVTVPITDPNTGEQTGETEQQDFDPITSEPIFEDLPIGDVNTYVIEPFRMTLDPLAMHLHEARWIMEYSIQSLDWIHEMYGKEGPGYTGLIDEVKEEKDLNNTMRRWFQLRTTAGLKDNAYMGGSGVSSSDPMIDNAAVIKEYYERPSMSYPKGRLVIIANETVVYSGDSPYEGLEQGDWHPYSECRWEIVPGRFWGKSPLDAISELQKRINSIDSIITLTRKTMAIPQKLIPVGSGITPGSTTGRPGQEHFYRPDSGAKPEIIPPVGLDPSVMAERAQCVTDMQELSGAIDILKGQNPPGVGAASALNLLYEVGTGKLYPTLDRWKAFVEEDQKKQIRLIGQKYKEPRPDFIRMLKSRNTDLVESDINQFIGSDLYDNYNVVVEAGSNIPKLQAAKQSMLMELAQMGMLNLQNPENRVQFQQDMGIQGYDSDIEPDRKRANWENDLIDNMIQSPALTPVVLVVDNHQLHLEVHQNRMKSPTFMSLPFEIQKAYMAHIQQHQQMEAQAQQAQMLQQQAMAPPGGGGAPQGPQQPASHKRGGHSLAPAAPGEPQGVQGGHGHGAGKQIKNAILGGDVLTPATLGSGSG